jgi:hypothetical protein
MQMIELRYLKRLFIRKIYAETELVPTFFSYGLQTSSGSFTPKVCTGIQCEFLDHLKGG